MQYTPKKGVIFIKNPDDKINTQPPTMEEFLKSKGRTAPKNLSTDDKFRSLRQDVARTTREEEKATNSTGQESRIEKAKYILEHQDLFTKEQVKKAKQEFTL